MTSGSFASHLLEFIFLPPGINLLLALAAWIIWRRWRRTARTLLFISTASLYALATPSIAFELINSLQSYPSLSLKQIKTLGEAREKIPTAIVILGGGRNSKAPEYEDTDTVNSWTLERLRYGAYLHHKTQLPILVSGGSPHDEPTAEAILMNQVLSDEFGVQVNWLEFQSKNTSENAQYTRNLIVNHEIKKILLVTHSWHMPRAYAAFESDQYETIAAPVGKVQESKHSSYFPSASALAKSVKALREHLGLLWWKIAG
ncbi:YdcF family protein [Pleionea sediminis]|uniref:YdcF family protein n=1 Tax=Pleionea sediminis TaxID=2569479 RepID=UPI001184FA50|nr:YdcF family protein [Pleionea sediminis]